MVKKGVVIRLKKRHAIVFNDIMEYEQIKRIEGMFEGQMIEYQASEKSNIYNKLKLLSGAAAVLMLFSAVFFGWFAESSRPHVFAYIGLDINPSVEFSIDDSSKVISTRALNDDGKNIIKPLSLKGKPIDRAITEVVQESKKEKIIKDESVILISTSLQAEDKAANEVKESSQMLKKTIGRIQENLEKDDSFNVSVKVVSVAPELRKDCLYNNISMGRYALYEKANNSGGKVSLQDARNKPVSELVRYVEEIDGDPANAQAARNGLISNTPAANTTEGKIAKQDNYKSDEKVGKQDNNKPEVSSAISALKTDENSAAPEPTPIWQESVPFKPPPYTEISSNTQVIFSTPDIVPPAHTLTPTPTPKPATGINTPDEKKNGKKSPISVNTPPRIPIPPDDNGHPIKKDFTPGPDKRRDHIGPEHNPREMPTHGHGMPPLVTPNPRSPLPERPPIISPDKGEVPHQDKRPDLPDKRPELPDKRPDLPGKRLNDMPRVGDQGTKTP